LMTIPGLSLLVPRQANAVFLTLPARVIDSLRAQHWVFYTFIGDGGVRLMCSWSTTHARIDELVKQIRHLSATAAPV